MATTLTPELLLKPLDGEGRTLREWLVTFHLAFVALDPFTNEGAWILPVGTRVLTQFSQADARVALVVTGTEAECRIFLGPVVNQLLVFPDPDRTIVNAFDLPRLPALVHVAMDATVAGLAAGWNPPEWQKVVDHLAKVTAWTAPTLPAQGDPGPF
ncbi:MAG TPA: hypothetical protein VNB24_06795 [Acidimicrobiales bacterium]|nr:hypothetical protein [Acidimicrobiales bacterium]